MGRRDLPLLCYIIMGPAAILTLIGFILALSGGLTDRRFNGDFATYKTVNCEVQSVKVVPFKTGLITRNVAIAGVVVEGDERTLAAIRQADTIKLLTRLSSQDALEQLGVKAGQMSVCGVPSTPGERATAFDAVRTAPDDLVRPAAVAFDADEAQAQNSLADNLLLAGSIMLGLGGIPLFLLILTASVQRWCCFCDDGCQCDVLCCVDNIEQRDLEARIKNSSLQQHQQPQSMESANAE